MNPSDLQNIVQSLETEISKVIVGHRKTVKLLLTTILAKGHCLLIGVPGLAKTLMVQTLGNSLGIQFGRIQFTPDLMPADILGSEFIQEHEGNVSLKFRKGPLFTQLLLADEINRTPPKTQSALLESMQERKVTVAGKVFELPKPFWVVATQNPIEQEGTYPLPEAQLDRFMFSLQLEYTSREDEVEVLRRTTIGHQAEVQQVTDAEKLLQAQELVRLAPVSDSVLDFAVKLAASTRPEDLACHPKASDYVEWGAGPRASQNLILGAKTLALMDGRPTPEKKDVKAVAQSVLSHRILLNYRATGEGIKPADLIQSILEDTKA